MKITGPVDSNVWRNRFAFRYKGGLRFSQQPQVEGSRFHPVQPSPPNHRRTNGVLPTRSYPPRSFFTIYTHTRASNTFQTNNPIESFVRSRTRARAEKHEIIGFTFLPGSLHFISRQYVVTCPADRHNTPLDAKNKLPSFRVRDEQIMSAAPFT